MSNGVISSNDLMHRLVQAKKVMNKVETGDFEKGHVNEQVITASPEEVASMVQTQNIQSAPKPIGTINMDRINNSKLPDVIKKAMIENPIPQISLNDNINMDFIEGAKKLMEREGLSKKTTKPKYVETNSYGQSNIDMSQIATLIENTVRKVLDEKLNQILTAQQTMSINESLVLKVGDSVFRGKITGVNKSK